MRLPPKTMLDELGEVSEQVTPERAEQGPVFNKNYRAIKQYQMMQQAITK